MTARYEKGHASREDVTQTAIEKFTSNSADDQRARLLAALRDGPISTIEARHNLDVMMPAARVFELRAAGHTITTTRVYRATSSGREHSVALYALQPAARDLFSDAPADANH
ncbi:helix-turn-helix domain-containing protein [Burkholderia ubonensis]|uniref:helix-turn-helix domain-containing protein n=1 Tax=Burkholderia ubonensis TaxID=101571 RepID=UPI0009B32F09|nr:helix-turn-helix domain-containing protein [Burkholderia ubonensis]